MRLIDADSIPWDVEGVGEIPVITKDEIDQMPEAVIRCKDCKFYIAQHGQCLDHDDDVLWLEDSYCSRAERKEK